MSDMSWLFGGNSINSNSNSSYGINLSDYAMIKNGSYKKLMKAYYAEEGNSKKSASSTEAKDSTVKSSLIKSNATALKKSVDDLNKSSLWNKKDITTIDEKTGETKTVKDYDWKAITKAVKSFVDNYNDTIDKVGESNNLGVLRDGLWMTKTTASNEKLLSKAGLTISSGNKLSLDEEALKTADISTLKTLFLGHSSYAGQVASKASGIVNASARESGTYTSSGTFSDIVSSGISGKIDEDV